MNEIIDPNEPIPTAARVQRVRLATTNPPFDKPPFDKYSIFQLEPVNEPLDPPTSAEVEPYAITVWTWDYNFNAYGAGLHTEILVFLRSSCDWAFRQKSFTGKTEFHVQPIEVSESHGAVGVTTTWFASVGYFVVGVPSGGPFPKDYRFDPDAMRDQQFWLLRTEITEIPPDRCTLRIEASTDAGRALCHRMLEWLKVILGYKHSGKTESTPVTKTKKPPRRAAKTARRPS